MTLKSAFETWNFLKREYEGDQRIKGMQVLNLVREFEMQKMKESETIKEYANKLLTIVNKVRLLGLMLLCLLWKILKIRQKLLWWNY